MKVLHYPGVYLAPSETFVARYIQASVSYGSTAVMSQFFDHSHKSFKGLQSVKQYKLKRNQYKRRSLKGGIRFVYEKTMNQNLHYSSIRRVVTEYQPDIIHCHFGIQGVLFNKAFQGRGLDVPFVVSFYGFDASVRPKTDPEYRKSLLPMFKKASAVFVEGEELKKKVVYLGATPDKVLINPILIPVSDYEMKKDWYSKGDSLTFLCAGRFIEKKGFHLFLEALGQIKEDLPPFEVIMVGNGKYKERYETIIQKHTLRDKVSFLGWLSHNTLLELMRKVDFFVHPSVTAQNGDSEGGAPTILLEAQAARVPIITSNHADIPNIMGYHDFVAKEGDINNLSEVILSAMQSTSLKELTYAGYDKVSKDHNLDGKLYWQNIQKVLCS